MFSLCGFLHCILTTSLLLNTGVTLIKLYRELFLPTAEPTTYAREKIILWCPTFMCLFTYIFFLASRNMHIIWENTHTQTHTNYLHTNVIIIVITINIIIIRNCLSIAERMPPHLFASKFSLEADLCLHLAKAVVVTYSVETSNLILLLALIIA